MNRIVILLLCLFSGFLCRAQGFIADSLALVHVLDQQEKAWNTNDIDAFMEGYWKSPSLVFCGSSGPVYGWEATRDRYKRVYNTPEKMGVLTFTILDVLAVQKDVMQLIGQFELERKPVPASGYFTLLWKRTRKGWKIVSDHTSAEAN
ncbi:MAG: YybH family protein [Flavobacteriaceae bacterium]